VKHWGIIEQKKLIPEVNGIVMELASGNLHDFLLHLKEPLGFQDYKLLC
jgi:hypothetical protein